MKVLRNLILCILQIVLVISFTACGNSGGGSASATGTAIDVTGFWGTSMLSAGSENGWERGTLIVNADNSTSHSTVDSKGTTTSFSGTISTSQTGTITLTGLNDIAVYLDSGGTVMHGVTTNDSGIAEIFTALKKGSYSGGDIEGAWKANILVSGASSPWWERGDLTIYSSGTFTASTIDIYGKPGYLTSGGSLNLSADGLVTMATYTNLKGVMDSDKTVIIWSDTWPNGTTELGILTRQADSYSEADLVGTWKFSSLSTGEASSIAKGSITVSSGGLYVANGSGFYQGKLLISPDGTVTIDGHEDIEGAMDAGKTVMVCTETLRTYGGLPSGSDMIIFTRQ